MILVTGATGLVGSHLLMALLGQQQDERVRVLVRHQKSIQKIRRTFAWYGRNSDTIDQRIEWAEGDIMDLYSIESNLSDVDYIYHCAGKVSFDKRDMRSLLQVNQSGTANMVNAALMAGVKKICHVSSVSALGKTQQGETITENHFWKTSRQNSIYALSKYAAEREIWRGHEEGLDAVVVNPSIILGPGNWDSGSSRLFSTIWKGVPAYTNGVGGYVDVRDVAAVMIRLMQSDISGERFIISSENWTFEEVIKTIATALNKKPPVIRLYPWMGEAGWMAEHVLRIFGREPTLTKEIARSAFHRFYYDNSKIRQTLGYDFIPVEKSIRDTATIFLESYSK